jgi:hypothetical protein
MTDTKNYRTRAISLARKLAGVVVVAACARYIVTPNPLFIVVAVLACWSYSVFSGLRRE